MSPCYRRGSRTETMTDLKAATLRSRHPRAVLMGAALGCALLASACSGASPGVSVAHIGTTTTTQPVKASSSNNGSPLAYAQCMRAHGVPDFPDPNAQGEFVIQGGPNSDLDPNSPQFQAANKDCQRFTPGTGLGSGPSPAQVAKLQAQALKYSQCMRSHGIADFPDPSFQGGGIRISIRAGPGSDLNPNSPQFQAAQQACQKLLPGRPGGARTFSSGGSGRGGPSGGGGNVGFGAG